MSQLVLTAIFIVIWLPSILFTASNMSVSPPIQETAVIKGPIQWKYEDRELSLNEKLPEFLLYGKIKTQSGPYSVTVRAGLIEWFYANSRRFKSDIRVFYTAIEDTPFVTEWLLEHDAGLVFIIADLRFNWIFVFSLFFCLAIPVLYVLMLFADDVAIDSPAERKRKTEDFVSLVKKIEQRAEKDPKWLKRKTISLAFLGYLVVLGSIVLMIPVGLGIFGIVAVISGGNVMGAKIAFVLALVPIGFAWHMGKSLLSSAVVYEGVEVSRKDCPDLFSLLGKICKKAKGPMFKRVFINQNLNASVTRSGGLLGFFGMGPVVLTLGLPLMQSMTEKQLAGVIGHEYGHVAAKDNAWGQWVYRIRNSWLMLGDRLGLDRLWYALKLNRFYAWFIAAFSAHSFALSRRCEYEADAFSAQLIGKDAMADALSSLVVFANQYDHKFWNQIWENSDNGEDIQSIEPYANTQQFFATIEDVSETASFALKQKTNYTSTHPAISDRLAALSAKFNMPHAPGGKASSRLLGNVETKLIEQFNQDWRAAVENDWQQRRDEHKKLLESYDELR